MYYEINVSLNGKHFFATSERSLKIREKCKRVLEELQKRFPVDEGWEFSVMRIEKDFYRVSLDELLK